MDLSERKKLFTYVNLKDKIPDHNFHQVQLAYHHKLQIENQKLINIFKLISLSIA